MSADPARSQLIVYNHLWDPGAEGQCGGCTSLTEAALGYARRVGNTMTRAGWPGSGISTWYFTAGSPFGADVDAPPGGGFAM